MTHNSSERAMCRPASSRMLQDGTQGAFGGAADERSGEVQQVSRRWWRTDDGGRPSDSFWSRGRHLLQWRRLLQMGLVAGTVLALILASLGSATVVRAQITTRPGPDGTPQFDPGVERRTYMLAAPDEVLTYWNVVQQEAALLPPDPGPEQIKSSNLRKRLLDLRLMLDFNAYLYDPSRLEPIRDQVDAAYEKVGLYKDLFDQSQLTGLPIAPDEQAKRAEEMNDALTWLRDSGQQRAVTEALHKSEHKILDLDKKETPRLWRIAEITPVDNQSSLATVALLAANVLANLERDGLLVDDILDPDQEAQFHDVRKALRSVLVLVDMFPTGTQIVGDRRDALAELVDAYGEVNDASIAYHDALESGHHEDDRKDDLMKAYKKARKLADQAVDDGELRAYVARITPLQFFDVDPFH
jgi:hypothetical protein